MFPSNEVCLGCEALSPWWFSTPALLCAVEIEVR